MGRECTKSKGGIEEMRILCDWRVAGKGFTKVGLVHTNNSTDSN